MGRLMRCPLSVYSSTIRLLLVPPIPLELPFRDACACVACGLEVHRDPSRLSVYGMRYRRSPAASLHACFSYVLNIFPMSLIGTVVPRVFCGVRPPSESAIVCTTLCFCSFLNSANMYASNMYASRDMAMARTLLRLYRREWPAPTRSRTKKKERIRETLNG